MAINVETHILIIWSKAREFEPVILEALQKKFLLRRIFNVQWKKEFFAENLKVFYAHSQKHLNRFQFNKVIQNKIDHCGDDSFCLVVFDDENPLYEDRITSSGKRPVNKNLFDLKQTFRDWTGGGHRIHASDNAFESNKDLTLLLKKNCKDFNNAFPGYSSESILFENNCLGIGGFSDLRQLFYLLNNTINYCVLRNFECLPDVFTLEGHGDIDLLVESINYIKHLTNAKPVYPDLDYRVHHVIQIDDQSVTFDFRFIGDSYYDTKWEISLLKSRKLFNDIVYIPNDENHFYTLLYHVFVQKPDVKEDYQQKLSNIGKRINISYNRNQTPNEVKNILDSFMNKNDYQYAVPLDKTVYHNKLFLEKDAERESRYGRKIAESQCRYENETFFSEVYLKDSIITKVASNEIINNEVEYLSLLKDYHYFSEIIAHKKGDEFGFVQTNEIQGIHFESIFHEPDFWTKKNILNCLKDGIEILKIMNSLKISHRDIRPENLILKKERGSYRLKLIDFGWATSMNDNNNITPEGLGYFHRYGDGFFSDCYSMGKIFTEYFNLFSFGKEIGYELQNITPDCYLDNEKVKIKLENIEKQYLLRSPLFTFQDRKWILLIKYPNLKKYAFKLTSLKPVNK